MTDTGLKWAFRLLVGASVLLACGVFYVLVDEAKHGRQMVHQQQVQACKAEQYDVYQTMVSLGMRRWEASCAAAVFNDANQKPFTQGGGDLSAKAEKQCFIQFKDCSHAQ